MAENVNLKLTTEAWAEIVIQIWQNKLMKQQAKSTGALMNSFAHHVVTNAGGDPERIEFAFNFYGKMVDMGVGKHVSWENAEAMRSMGLTTRRKKSWYKGTWYQQIEKLVELLETKFEQKASIAILETLDNEKL